MKPYLIITQSDGEHKMEFDDSFNNHRATLIRQAERMYKYYYGIERMELYIHGKLAKVFNYERPVAL